MEISKLPDKEFKEAVIKMFTEFKRRMKEPSKNFNRDLERTNIRKNQSKMKITISEIKKKLH